ncbi:MAG: T9SS type A sorting domain-containing protein [Bacteroidetes bacterium]|nr:T9SS type A sorting domain-containing protein [Bacteroidota bacterium]
MKKNIFIRRSFNAWGLVIYFLSLFVSQKAFAQNIVVNPDFEQFTICPVGNGELQKADNWLDAVYSADYMNCIYQGWTPQAVTGAQNGLGYAGFATYGNPNGAAESFGQFLATPLIAGNSYRISFYAKRSNSGFYSSVCTGVCVYGFNGNPVAGGAQTNICTDQLPGAILLGCCDTVSDVNWLQYTINFTAPSALDFVVFTPGCALNCAEYIYIDNINLMQPVNFANVCFGDTTVFLMGDTTSMVSADWNFSDLASGINNFSTLFNPSHVFTSTGIFLVRVIRTYVNTSVDTVIIPVTIYPQVNVNLGNDTTICQGQSMMLNAAGTGITTYAWQDGSSAPTFVADTSGIYFVSVSNPGCNASDTLNLNVISCTSIIASFQSVDSLICPGTCTNFTNFSINATSYLWSFPGANPNTSTDVNPQNICYNTPGNYDVTLIATNGALIDTITISNYITVYPYPAPQGISQAGDTLIANQGAITYQWYLNGNIINGATNYFYIAPQSGDYNVVCTDANNCEVEAVIFDVIASVNSEVRGLMFELYPNPVGDKVIIQIPIAIGIEVTRETAVEISIYNMLSEMVLAVQLQTSNIIPITIGTETILDVSELASGLYYIEITAGEKTFRSKFVKSTYR